MPPDFPDGRWDLSKGRGRQAGVSRQKERSMNRRDFLSSTSAAAFGLGMAEELFAQSPKAPPRSGATWDSGSVVHILPQASDTRMLIKASFNAPLMSEPTLRVGNTTARGRMSDTRGEYWQFNATGLRPGQRYQLSLV